MVWKYKNVAVKAVEKIVNNPESTPTQLTQALKTLERQDRKAGKRAQAAAVATLTQVPPRAANDPEITPEQQAGVDAWSRAVLAWIDHPAWDDQSGNIRPFPEKPEWLTDDIYRRDR